MAAGAEVEATGTLRAPGRAGTAADPGPRTARRRLAWLAAWAAAVACAGAPPPPVAPPPPSQPDAQVQGEFEALWAHYERQISPKAFAFGFDGNEWVWGISERAVDRSAAGRQALELCERARVGRGVRAPCALYALDGEIVWSLADHLLEFQSYPLHKAFWVAGPRAQPVFDAVIRAESPEAAARQAMRDCEAEVGPYGLAHTCRICQIDDGVPCTQLESGWLAE
ncbi:MAG: hypothetical protein ACQGVK_12195 [Myxococcota bacterium]